MTFQQSLPAWATSTTFLIFWEQSMTHIVGNDFPYPFLAEDYSGCMLLTRTRNLLRFAMHYVLLCFAYQTLGFDPVAGMNAGELPQKHFEYFIAGPSA